MKGVLTRLADQLSWSGGFFLANLWAAVSLSVEDYAASTIASSLGVIGAAITRAYSVDASLVVASRGPQAVGHSGWFSTTRTLGTSLILGSGIAVACLLWFTLSDTLRDNWYWSILAFVISVGDAPHYGMIMLGIQRRALIVGLCYVFGIMAAYIIGQVANDFHVMLAWTFVLLLVATVGWILIGERRSAVTAHENRPTAVRMAAESLYSAMAGQLGILLLFLVASAESTAGVRLAYSLVFAPIFMVIQGLFPLLFRHVAYLARHDAGRMARILGLWIVAGGLGLAVVSVVAVLYGKSTLPYSDTLALAIPFVVPVGLSMAGSLTLDAGLLRWRLNAAPTGPHRVRLVLSIVDLSLQVALVLTLGVSGLVVGLAVGGVLKLITGGYFTFARKSTLNPPGSGVRIE